MEKREHRCTSVRLHFLKDSYLVGEVVPLLLFTFTMLTFPLLTCMHATNPPYP
uniref:Uncharacterized protein n=1 Tax=Picea sitchensis TaxID=3332 RepID=A0A6B9XZG4_PICSI|nr:hypothetical protein Q903MT_gene6903 [Picea sitchensis]